MQLAIFKILSALQCSSLFGDFLTISCLYKWFLYDPQDSLRSDSHHHLSECILPPHLSQGASETRGKGGRGVELRPEAVEYSSQIFSEDFVLRELGIHWMPTLRVLPPTPWKAPSNIPSFCGLFQLWIWAGCMTQFNQHNKAEMTLCQFVGLSYQKVWQL